MSLHNNAATDDGAEYQLKLIGECLQLQIDELVMLQSIFCSGDEFCIDDPSIEADINEFLDNTTNTKKLLPTSQLQYTVRIQQHPSHTNCPIDIRFELPQLYPKIELANVSVLCSAIGPTASRALRLDLNEYMRSLEVDGEVYVYQLYQWVLDNVANYDNVKNVTEHIDSNDKDKPLNKSDIVTVERLWIYSHHLKSRQKRQNLIRLAGQLHLSGFSRPGKPGIICVEGVAIDVQEYWRTVRQWCWQKIQQRRSETEVFGSDVGIESFRRFPLPFQELLWNNCSGGNNSASTTNGAARVVAADDEDKDTENNGIKNDDEIGEQVMSMASFIKYLEQHHCGYIKKDLFGFD